VLSSAQGHVYLLPLSEFLLTLTIVLSLLLLHMKLCAFSCSWMTYMNKLIHVEIFLMTH